jgi:DNA-binding MarR family transcriptional regulator
MGAVTETDPTTGRPGAAAGSPVPLARLLAMAFRDLVDQLHERLAEQGWHDVRPAYGFVLLAARERGTTGSEIAALLGMTKQAASKLVDAMAAAGLVERRAAEVDGRTKRVVLTAEGERFLAAVERIYADLEGAWADALGGPAALERLRSDLLTVLQAAHGATHPAIRPSW